MLRGGGKVTYEFLSKSVLSEFPCVCVLCGEVTDPRTIWPGWPVLMVRLSVSANILWDVEESCLVGLPALPSLIWELLLLFL